MDTTRTIETLFAANAARTADKVLFERPGESTVTFGETAALVGRLANALRRLGVAPGDRVAVQVEKSPEAMALYLATLRIGAVFLPLNTAYTAGEVDYFLDDAEPALFVCPPASGEATRARRSGRPAVETLGENGDGSLLAQAAAMPTDAPRAAVGEHGAAAILYTSGTTGRSKGAVLTHGNLVSNCLTLLDAWRFTAEDRLIHALPIFHVHGLFVAGNMALAAGATMIFCKRFDPEEAIDLMAGASVLMGVPTFYTRLLASPRLSPETAGAMRLFVSGSAPLLSADHRRFRERTGHAILERYGMTECGMIASNPYEGERRAGSVGPALDGVEVRVTDREAGAPLAPGEIGAIEVRGPNVFREYWRMPEKTASEFTADGFFRTGDVGTLGPDGYLSIVGRDKDLVITGGLNVYPKEVETLLDAHPQVTESAVVGLPHPDLGEAVTALVVRRAGGVTEADLLAAIAPDLAGFKRPKRILFVEALPRNVMGKVQKAELRRTYATLYEG